MSEADQRDGRETAPLVVGGVGAVVVVATVGEWVVLLTRGGTVDPGRVAIQVPINLLPAAGLLYAAAWLGRSDLSTARFARIGYWTVGGVGVSLALNLVIMLGFPPDPLGLAVGWLRTAAVLGAVVGVGVGVVEARAIDRSLSAERANLRAEAAERQREQLDYLNSLLRHEILNAVNVIDGQSKYVMDRAEVDADSRERLAAVRRQSQRMTEVISDVRVLIEATRGRDDVEPVDLPAMLEAEAVALRDREEVVEVRTDLPSGVTVPADALLARAFGNLLDNAVEHNESESPRVDVVGEVDADSVRVSVRDNGPGVPPAEQEVMFRRGAGSNHGLGLYLVRTLVERYDGSVELTDTGDDGSEFTVELPLGDAPTTPDRAAPGPAPTGDDHDLAARNSADTAGIPGLPGGESFVDDPSE